MELACGIITAPREESYLARTVQSLVNAGLVRVSVFAEPGSGTADTFSRYPIDLHLNQRKLGNFYNWVNAATSMLRSTTAKLILIAEDDVLFGASSIQDAIEAWPTLRNPGFLSLYTPTHYQMNWAVKSMKDGRTIKQFECPDAAKAFCDTRTNATIEIIKQPEGILNLKIKSLFGALGLVFDRDVLVKVLKSDILLNWKRQYLHLPSHKLAWIDACLGRVINNMHLGMYHFNPSRAQHLGEKCSLQQKPMTHFRRAEFVKLER